MTTTLRPSFSALSIRSESASSLAEDTCSVAASSSLPTKPPVSWDSRKSLVSTLVTVTLPEERSA